MDFRIQKPQQHRKVPLKNSQTKIYSLKISRLKINQVSFLLQIQRINLIVSETDKEAIKQEESAKGEDGNTPPGTPPRTPSQGDDKEGADQDGDTSPTGPELPEADNSRDSNSREAADELNKAVEDEIDDDKDVYLFKLEQILTKIHSEYFKKYDNLTDR